MHQPWYSLQRLRKVHEGAGDHPDRDAQFQWIYDHTAAFQTAGHPVIYVDTEKKELVGHFRNLGREWHPQKCPPTVEVDDDSDRGEGKESPYDVYDVTTHEGFVNVGTSHDPTKFALMSVRQWWAQMGQVRYPGRHCTLSHRRRRRK